MLSPHLVTHQFSLERRLSLLGIFIVIYLFDLKFKNIFFQLQFSYNIMLVLDVQHSGYLFIHLMT